MLTQFVTDVTSDSNNPKKKTVNLKIVPREQGGGYIFSFHFDNQDIEVHVGFRLSK
ncbi:hypothetical protein H6768_03875 [Candidatus Peribacteria bacterium]|nr:hypothetical protein [Candidatus Peribacteria bacterium]